MRPDPHNDPQSFCLYYFVSGAKRFECRSTSLFVRFYYYYSIPCYIYLNIYTCIHVIVFQILLIETFRDPLKNVFVVDPIQIFPTRIVLLLKQ